MLTTSSATAFTLFTATVLALTACQRDVVPPCTSCGSPGVPNLSVVWSDAGSTTARPVADDRALYVLGQHAVAAFDKSSGQPLWNTALTVPDGPTFLQGYGTAIAAGLLIVGDIDLFGIDRATGVIRWRFAPRTTFPNERTFQRLATDGTTIYIGGVWGNVYAVDAATGAPRWTTHVTTLPDSMVRVFSPVVDNGVVFVTFDDDTPPRQFGTDGGVAAIDAATGRLLWSQYLPRHFDAPTESDGVAVTPTRVVAGTLDGFLYGLDRQTGVVADTISQTVFGFAAGRAQSTVFKLETVSDTLVLAGTDNGELTAFDGRQLTHRLWQVATGGSPSDVVVISGVVYVNYGGTVVGAVSLAMHKFLWTFGPEFSPGPEIFQAAPAVDNDRLYLGSDHHIYALARPSS
jgi:outer membrane protein assembly factor BamB